FKQVDVFTDRPLYGNPVAVVLDADGIDPEEMQRIASWTNLSETTFVLKPTTPEADYRLRIFTPTAELPFAGHPTVGSAHAALEAGVVSGPTFRQECGAGVLPMSVTDSENGSRIAVEAPEAAFVKEYGDIADAISAALGVNPAAEPTPAAMSNGPVWLFVRLENSEALAGLEPDLSAVAKLSLEHGLTGLAPFALLDGEPRTHIRCFAPAFGVPEDPVTGSANAALPAYLAHAGLLDALGGEYVSTQGTELGRDGKVFVRVLDDQGHAEIGGHAVTVIEGEIRL
ncbi:MAG: PhzF family phenazine biosynthesis protein, partial [Chloroflexi bacterium]|nr:PhzF family phenazine biosynthesis protein [Chloroflexota bacterium]